MTQSPRITQDWLSADATQAVFHLLEDAGYQAYCVGGCVRDALLGRAVHDIDIATDARPETVSNLAKQAGFKAIPTGIDHGTITVISGDTPFEITTFRKDVETDGRHAVVAFSDDIATDAGRRDFTMNALYAAADGSVVDPLGGLPDLDARRVRFIGEARDRIAEDYLRILRYFRFSAWYADPDLGQDTDTLAAIAEGLDGLDRLADERITTEIVKLLSARDPAPTLGVMQTCGVLDRVMPGANVPTFARLVHHAGAQGVTLDTATRLAGLSGHDSDNRLRLDKVTMRGWEANRTAASGSQGPAELAYRHGAEAAARLMILRAALLETPVADYADQIALGAGVTFPVRAADLMPTYQGKALGDQLRALEARWIASGFVLDRDDLLS